MSTPLSSIQELIERSIFEAIRLQVVDKGYLPDITAVTGTPPVAVYPDTEVGWAKWEEDMKAIKDSAKDFVIEIFNGGSNQSRGVKKVPRIVMDPGNFLPGALGGDPRRFFSDQGESYKALVTPPQTTDFYLNISLVSDNIQQLRILNSLLALAIPRKGYVKWYNDNTKTFFVRYLNFYNQNSPQDGILEHVYAYEIPDAWDHDDVEVIANVAKMQIIEMPINVQKYMDGSWGYNSDTIIASSGD